MSIAVLFCSKCGSHQLDVTHWPTPEECIIRCSNCGTETRSRSLTVARVFNDYDQESEVLLKAIRDIAEPSPYGAARLAPRITRAALQHLADRLGVALPTTVIDEEIEAE